MSVLANVEILNELRKLRKLETFVKKFICKKKQDPKYGSDFERGCVFGWNDALEELERYIRELNEGIRL